MKDFYCLEIRFNEAIIEDRSWLHSHLKIDQDEIELKVFYSGEIDISRKYFEWSSNNKDWNKLSLYSEIKISSSENELLDVNTEDSKITGLKSGEIDANGNYYLTILLDSIVISKPPVSELNNTARILLNEQGFDLVKGFYSIFTQVKKDVFDIQRMNGMETSGAHSALFDAELVVKVLSFIRKKQPHTWNSFLRTANSSDTETIIKKEKMFTFSEFYFGKGYLFLLSSLHPKACMHQLYPKWAHAVDLKFNIEPLLDMIIVMNL